MVFAVLALFYWLKLLADEGGEETAVPGENPWRRASENATYLKPENANPNLDSNPYSSIRGRLGKQTC